VEKAGIGGGGNGKDVRGVAVVLSPMRVPVRMFD
jgi:hypothetical protein